MKSKYAIIRHQISWGKPVVLSKVRKDGNVESEVFIYVDDVLSMEWCNRECWNATRCFTLRCIYLGIQYAPRKRKGPYHRQGLWAGSKPHTSYGLEGMLYQEKWDNMKRMLR